MEVLGDDRSGEKREKRYLIIQKKDKNDRTDRK
jgi:hypothetical protein